jgi:predicted transcriptional regulator
MINQNPEQTLRKISQKIGISNGSSHYLLRSLIDRGFVKFSNYNMGSKKINHYLMTPKGICKKSLFINKFVNHKKNQYDALKKEISELEQDGGMLTKPYNSKKIFT